MNIELHNITPLLHIGKSIASLRPDNIQTVLLQTNKLVDTHGRDSELIVYEQVIERFASVETTSEDRQALSHFLTRYLVALPANKFLEDFSKSLIKAKNSKSSELGAFQLPLVVECCLLLHLEEHFGTDDSYAYDLQAKLEALTVHITAKVLSESASLHWFHTLLTELRWKFPRPGDQQHSAQNSTTAVCQGLVSALQKLLVSDDSPALLLPTLLQPKIILAGKSSALAPITMNVQQDDLVVDMLLESGPSKLNTYEKCRTALLSVGRSVTASAIAKFLLMILRQHYTESNTNNENTTGIASEGWADKEKSGATNPDGSVASSFTDGTSGWNLEILMSVMLELTPTITAEEVIVKLDSKSFIVNDRVGLLMFVTATRRLANCSYGRNDTYPIATIYHPWQNTEQQILLLHAMLNNPDVFCFFDYPCQQISIDMLKSIPEHDNKEIATWRSLALMETLLSLSRTHYEQCIHMLGLARQCCPDVLMLGMAQTSLPMCLLKQECVKATLPTFLDPHPNSTAVLHALWDSTGRGGSFKQILMQVLGDWYEPDQTRLSRILEISQDLKALNQVLSSTQPFVIDLACLAARREYLKFDKWLNDEITKNGEPFVSTLIKYVHQRCPGLVSTAPTDDPSKGVMLPVDILAIIIQGLNPYVRHLLSMDTGNHQGNAVSQACITMYQSISTYLNRQSNAVRPDAPQQGIVQGLGKLALAAANPNNVFTSQLPASPAHPVQQSAGQPPSEMAVVFDLPQQVDKAIEDEANSFFQRIYNNASEGTINEVLDTLRIYYNSAGKRETDVYTCMLRNLFEEYRFFPTYPEKELQTTARLLGGIIDHKIIGYIHLGIALRYVSEALLNDANSRMHQFGILALDSFKGRLKEHQKYCLHLKELGTFDSFPPHLKEYIIAGVSALSPSIAGQPSHMGDMDIMESSPHMSQHMNMMQHQQKMMPQSQHILSGMRAHHQGNTPSHSQFVTIHGGSNMPVGTMSQFAPSDMHAQHEVPEVPVEKVLEKPPEEVISKIGFIFNNLSKLNIEEKKADFQEVLTELHYDWVSNYLVTKRVMVEFNFHTLYFDFIERIKSEALYKSLLSETIRIIKRLLRSEKLDKDRHVLKNLGHWLGILTLGKNRPILFVDIDMHSLIIEAYLRGPIELNHCIPFVTRVLESCEKSTVFNIPNPWTTTILDLLAEFHQFTETKLALKFEIEVTCKKLAIPLEDLRPGNILSTAKSVKNAQLYNPTEQSQMMSAMMSQSKRAESTPLLPSMPNFQQQPFMAGHGGSLSEVGAGTSSSAGATPTPQHPTVSHALPTPLNLQAALAAQQASNLGGAVAQPQQPQVSVERKYSYNEVNLTNMGAGLLPYITVKTTQIASDPVKKVQIIEIVKAALEKAIPEVVKIIIEKCIASTVPTIEVIVRKDFSLDGDENRMRLAAQSMARHLASGYAMTNGKEFILSYVSKSIAQHIAQKCNSMNSSYAEKQVEQIAQSLTVENFQLASVFVQKFVCERVVQEVDKKLLGDYDLRKMSRSENKHFFDNASLQYHAERMPEILRLKVGPVPAQQTFIYEEFARAIPGFLLPEPSLSLPNVVQNQQKNNMAPTEDVQMFFSYVERVVPEMESLGTAWASMFPTCVIVQDTLVQTINMVNVMRAQRDLLTVPGLVKRLVESLFEVAGDLPTDKDAQVLLQRFRDVHLALFKATVDLRSFGPQWLTKAIARCWMEIQSSSVRYHVDVFSWLHRHHLVSMPDVDEYLARALQVMNTPDTLLFMIHLLQNHGSEEPGLELPVSTRILTQVCSNRQMPEAVFNVIDSLRNKNEAQQQMAPLANVPVPSLASNMPDLGVQPSGNNTASMHFTSGVNQARDFNDPPGLSEKCEVLLREWINLYHSTTAGYGSSNAFTHFVKQMNAVGILKNDEYITRFFRNCVTFCREYCIQTMGEHIRQQQASGATGAATATTGSAMALANYRNKCYQHVDPFVRLVALLIKHSGETANPSTKINLLNKVLGLICGLVNHDIDQNASDFYQLPYHRILIMLYMELQMPETVLESINAQILMAFTQTLHLLRPQKYAGFAYAWLEIVGHRAFIGRMLAVPPQAKAWSMYSTLLCDLLLFLAPYLRGANMKPPIEVLYKGTLRVLLVLLHDFPEFLCEYHYNLCDAIPTNCLQMKNLVLSAFPTNMRVPDPFTKNFRMEGMADLKELPKMSAKISLEPAEFLAHTETYLATRAPVTFFTELRGYLQASPQAECGRYNTPAINALVMHVGMSAVAQIRDKGQVASVSNIAHSAHMDIFQNLAVDMDTEGRYLFLNAVANQLRFPNAHTQYFSCTLLYLFAEANNEAIQEQITRVLLERLIVNRPHPWGLLITFIELIRNPSYDFWSHEFVKCAPEIEKLVREFMVKMEAPRS